MTFKLPPLNTLRLFEAAARLGSFKLAAEEVHVTPSAVSHGIQTLESWLGVDLFDRGPRVLSLTPAGKAYAPEVCAALTILSAATQRLPGRRATGSLSVSCAPTFANRWLLPRLSGFTHKYPDLRVTLDTARRYVEFPGDSIDVAIRMSSAPRSSEAWVHLISEKLVPVCSPAVLTAMDCNDLEIIRRGPLIHLTSVRDDWSAWFQAKGLTAPAGRAIRVDTIHLAAEAAVQGLGVALGRRPLIDALLAAGDLVEVAGPAIPTKSSYWLVTSHLSVDRPEVKAFRSWILKELDSAPAPSAVAVPPRQKACA